MKTVVINPKQLFFCGRKLLLEIITAFFAAFFAALSLHFSPRFFVALFATSCARQVPAHCRAKEFPFMSQQSVYVK